VYSLLHFYFYYAVNLLCLLKDCHVKVCRLFFEELAQVHIELTICAFFIRFYYVVEASKLFGYRKPNKGLPSIRQCLLHCLLKPFLLDGLQDFQALGWSILDCPVLDTTTVKLLL
jgi:hypothetical protein